MMYEIEAIRRSGASEFYSYSSNWYALSGHAAYRTSHEQSLDPVVALAVYGNDGTGEFRPFMFLNGPSVLCDTAPSMNLWMSPIDKRLYGEFMEANRELPWAKKSGSSMPTNLVPDLHPGPLPNMRIDLRPLLPRLVSEKERREAAARLRRANQQKARHVSTPPLLKTEDIRALVGFAAIVAGFIAILYWILPRGPDTTKMSDEEYQHYQESLEVLDSGWEAIVPR